MSKNLEKRHRKHVRERETSQCVRAVGSVPQTVSVSQIPNNKDIALSKHLYLRTQERKIKIKKETNPWVQRKLKHKRFH